jgi:hypothetical protein
MRVTVYGKPGKIVRARSNPHYVHVRFDGQKHSVPAHPNDRVDYAPGPAAIDGPMKQRATAVAGDAPDRRASAPRP